MPDVTITAQGAVAEALRDSAFSALSGAGQALDVAADRARAENPSDDDQFHKLDRARRAVVRADAIVEQLGYGGEDPVTLTAPAETVAELAGDAMMTLHDRMSEWEKTGTLMRYVADVTEALETILEQANAHREPVEA